MATKDEGSDSMRMFGAVSKALRAAAGVSQEALGEHVGYSKSLVQGVESGTRMPSQRYVELADPFLNANGTLLSAAAHLSRQRFPSWFEDFVSVEKTARSLWTYCTNVLHGLVQTEEYADAVLSAYCPALEEDEIAERLQARLERQSLLTRKPICDLSIITEESVLLRPLGGKSVQKRQLEHLLKLAELRHVSIQVMPLMYESHAGFDGPLTLLETPEHRWLGYAEGQNRGFMFDDPEEVSALHQRYSMIRSQALTPRDSRVLIEKLVGEL
ncbi:helix-turn-helix domain-containing protein [Streptantibioticus ferralitis]|uniref:Helix-turn-helix transcriptional regulator n=1 Tax=Streptantibioticus ferralitis TaxID=236510 RepID=A0ABT5Z3T2_9ACTN|nr:helix-turn-helix transcriptional regulator [Streptantibioticus ferralitis]MDF2258487.1 helix-turn-helix transcriptional regulator [Streptantibioticus ferralitis]